MKKRYRACEECHRLKIKCDASSSSGPACDRCSRNNIVCIPAAPRLQRDRINELEAQVQELQNALQAQSLNSTPGRSPESLLENQYDILASLDARIPFSTQQHLLHRVGLKISACWPIIQLPTDLDHIRTKSPVLLLCVVVFGVTQDVQGTDSETHDDLLKETMFVLGRVIIGQGQASLELVQALLIAAFWYKCVRRGDKQGSCYQLIQLAVDMAVDIGIAGPIWQPSPAAYFARNGDPTSLEARRTWLACFITLSTVSLNARRTISIPWDSYHQECLLFVETSGKPSDLLLGQIVRITHLIQDIVESLHLCHIGVFVDPNERHTHVLIETFKNKVDAWASQIPSSLAKSQILKVWYHIAMVCLHEVVLHTATNKASFAAPFIPGRLPSKDYPQPLRIIAPLRVSLEILVHNCHAAITTAAEMDPELVLDLPTLCFAPHVVYTLYVLVAALVASTDPLNTYGQVLSKEDFQIEECSMKLRTLTDSIRTLDPTASSYATLIFGATSWLEQWYYDYLNILHRFETSLTI